METIVYRQDGVGPMILGMATNDIEGYQGEGRFPSAPADKSAWHPGIVYPCVSEVELAIWEHWLPTAVVCSRVNRDLPGELVDTLTWLDAPPEVLEECRWSCALELFDAYEIRTPERRDLRDPLVIGQCGSQRYRVALWGESLRPFEEITALVQESLALRKRTARWQALMMGGGHSWGLPSGCGWGVSPRLQGARSEPLSCLRCSACSARGCLWRPMPRRPNNSAFSTAIARWDNDRTQRRWQLPCGAGVLLAEQQGAGRA